MPRVHPNLWDREDEGILDSPKKRTGDREYRRLQSKVNHKTLRRFINRPWNEAFSWISSHSKYNEYMWLLSSVALHTLWDQRGYVVDTEGILRYYPYRRYRQPRRPPITQLNLGGRHYRLRDLPKQGECGCLSFKFRETDYYYHRVATCIHGNEKPVRQEWFLAIPQYQPPLIDSRIATEADQILYGIPKDTPYSVTIEPWSTVYVYRSLRKKEKNLLQKVLTTIPH